MRTLAMTSLLLAACSSDVGAVPVAITDPLALIDEIEGDLRLYVLPGATHSCEPTTGMVTPDVADLAVGMVPEATADLSLPITGTSATQMLEVPVGDYTVLVRGKGTDIVTGRMDVFIATACADATIANGETREVRLTLLRIVGSGVCGDGTLSPDEQCDDSGTSDGDGCSASCRTEPFVVNTTVAGTQNNPSVAGAASQRWFFSYDDSGNASRIRVLEADLSTVTSPSALAMDATIDDAVPDVDAGVQLVGHMAESASGRIGYAFVDFLGAMTATRVSFFDQNRATGVANALVIADGSEEPRGAFAGDGTYLVAFQDGASSTGISAQVFASGATTPASGTPFVVGQGGAGATGVTVAGASDHFVLAFSSGGDVFIQRIGTDGTPRDAMGIPAGDGAGTQDQPSIAAMSDGRLVVAWRDDGPDGDGAGTAIRARAYAADGTAGAPIVVNTTTAGDQSEPAITSGNDSYAIAFRDSTGISTGIRARVLAASGDPISNRDRPPTTADFAVTGAGTDVAIAAGGSGTPTPFLVVWAEGGDIRARAFPLP